MTPNSYEELVARLQRMAVPAHGDDEDTLLEAIRALADLRKQLDEARALNQLLSQVEHKASWVAQAETLRAENERLTRELAEATVLQADTIDHLSSDLRAAEAEAERLRKVAEGERERCAVVCKEYDTGGFGKHNMVTAQMVSGELALTILALPPPALTASDGPSMENEDGR